MRDNVGLELGYSLCGLVDSSFYCVCVYIYICSFRLSDFFIFEYHIPIPKTTDILLSINGKKKTCFDLINKPIALV